MSVLNLDKCRDLFRSDTDFAKFVERFETAAQEDGAVPLVLKDRHVGTVFSPKKARELLGQRILDRIIAEPGLLDDLQTRMEGTGDFVKWPSTKDEKK